MGRRGARGVAARLIAGVVDCRPGEAVPALLAALQFFLLLFGYFMLRPLRETMGLARGADHVQTLFQISAGAMVVAVPLYSFAASRIRRGVLVPGVYAGSILCLAGFLAAMLAIPEGSRAWLGDVYYVWLSVFNLFIVSVFWQLLADVFSHEQGKRLFGFIGVGGTAGAIAGSAYSWKLADVVGSVGLIASATAMIAVSMCIALVLCRVGRTTSAEASRHPAKANGDASDRSEPGPLGGSAFAGIARLFSSRFLGGIGLVVMLFAITSTLLYFEKLRIVEAAAEADNDRTSLFAGITLAGQTLTIVFQVLLTGRLMRWLGVGSLLAVVPLVSIVGFAVLDFAGSIVVYTVFEATRSASNYALSKPARETLFTVVPRADKYKAKSGIDTFVYRGGDLAGSFVYRAIAAVGAPISVMAVPLGICGVGLAWWLGREGSRRGSADQKRYVDQESGGDDVGVSTQQPRERGNLEREQHATIAS
jgi:AAA family ATP:ADP antiporter